MWDVCTAVYGNAALTDAQQSIKITGSQTKHGVEANLFHETYKCQTSEKTLHQKTTMLWLTLSLYVLSMMVAFCCSVVFILSGSCEGKRALSPGDRLIWSDSAENKDNNVPVVCLVVIGYI